MTTTTPNATTSTLITQGKRPPGQARHRRGVEPIYYWFLVPTLIHHLYLFVPLFRVLSCFQWLVPRVQRIHHNVFVLAHARVKVHEAGR